MPEIVPGRPEALKGSAAAAVLLMLFDEDEAAQILSRLEPDEVRQLGYAMYDVQDVEPEEVNEALDHFVNKAKKRTTIGYGATRHIRGAMTKALGEERAETILARITPPTRSTQLEMLKWMDAKEIAALNRGGASADHGDRARPSRSAGRRRRAATPAGRISGRDRVPHRHARPGVERGAGGSGKRSCCAARSTSRVQRRSAAARSRRPRS